jgi:tRNA(Phe) wybutosine-synthesizing methylase Tyw3
MISTLKSSINFLESAEASLKSSYAYNDESADKGKILKSKSEINGLINSLNNEILPAIKQKIKKIKDDIEEAEAKALALK